MAGSEGSSGASFEKEMSDFDFEIEIDDCERSEVEDGMGAHQHPEPAGEREDRAEDGAGDQGLLGAGKALIEIVQRSEEKRGDDHRDKFRAGIFADELARALEEIAAE